MSEQRIIYQTQDSGVAVIIPTGKVPIEIVAEKDVPTGVPYLITTTDDIPSDRTFRAAWEADFSTPDGHGADYGSGSTKAVIGYEEDDTPILKDMGVVQ